MHTPGEFRVGARGLGRLAPEGTAERTCPVASANTCFPFRLRCVFCDSLHLSLLPLSFTCCTTPTLAPFLFYVSSILFCLHILSINSPSSIAECKSYTLAPYHLQLGLGSIPILPSTLLHAQTVQPWQLRSPSSLHVSLASCL